LFSLHTEYLPSNELENSTSRRRNTARHRVLENERPGVHDFMDNAESERERMLPEGLGSMERLSWRELREL
jgi:hypothetical protein